jgi:ATP phosphoribosyltransferase regulatory subunit
MKSLLTQEIELIVERNTILKELEKIAEERKYIKVLPDYFEEYDQFLELNKRINPRNMVKIIAPSNDIFLLRPDITTNIIKQLTSCWVDGELFPLYYNTTVFEQNQKAIIQSRQFGLEYLGSNDLQVEIKVLEDTLAIFKRFKNNFKVIIGNQLFIDQLIDKIDYLKKPQMKNILLSKDEEQLISMIKGNTKMEQLLKEIFTINGSFEEVITKLSKYEDIEFVKETIKTFEELGSRMNQVDIQYIMLDLSLLSQFDYYSGIIVQGYLKSVPTPVLKGGRYNNLTKEMGKEIPAFGIAFDVLTYVKEVRNV